MNPNLIADTIQRALDAAGLDRTAGEPDRIRTVIDNAFKAAGLGDPGLQTTEVRRRGPAPVRPALPGRFIERSYSNALGSRAYKLYVPSADDGSPRPLLLMLHGCTQGPDDFAAGTRMNALAERQGLLVAYPAQTARENGRQCWNWFEPSQQRREGAEPSLLAGIVAEICTLHAVDAGQVFVAGLSAGAAMAVVLGQTYPDVFAGVAAHSGLAAGAAHDVASAFAAMQGRGNTATAIGPGRAVPTIVFHGDADTTVAAANGKAIVGEAVSAFERDGVRLQGLTRADEATTHRRSTVTEFSGPSGRALVEEWVVHGGGHAWYGGSPTGSFTDGAGPDASAEIVRFFLQLRAP